MLTNLLCVFGSCGLVYEILVAWFDIARDIVSAKTVFTTHTPVPAGNDIFPLDLVEKYFKNYWTRFGITKEEFFRLGMKPNAIIANRALGVFSKDPAKTVKRTIESVLQLI